VRVAAAANDSGEQKAMKIAFRTGGVAGMFTVGLGLFGAVDIGQGAYWWDYGQLKLYFANNIRVTEVCGSVRAVLHQGGQRQPANHPPLLPHTHHTTSLFTSKT
jgi:hypothetical protein